MSRNTVSPRRSLSRSPARRSLSRSPARSGVVTAYDVKSKKLVPMLDASLVTFKGKGGSVRYRLSGKSRDGNKLSKFISAADAQRYM